MSDNTYGVVVFPFLKTSSPVSIGGTVFQSTDNFDGLTPEKAKSVSDISKMLFLRDDLRIRSASFAVIPNLSANDRSSPNMIHLSYLQDAVAYLYGSPHPIFGDVFLTPEHASLAIFNPDQVFIHQVQSDYNVDSPADSPAPSSDGLRRIPGFSGLYNFKHPFWVVPGSRLYGPQPRLTLNIAQDLSNDITTWSAERPDFGLLFDLLDKPTTEFSMRIFAAIRWFNGAGRGSIHDHEAIVNLPIAFESLLALPQAEKSDRLVDSISLLLGRVPRLRAWARQFYDARSKIVHEGRAQQLYFVVTDDLAKSPGDQIYQSLLTYGRQIFRLCLGTLLVGASLAEEAGLEEQLISNQERFERICKNLDDARSAPRDRLISVVALVDAVEHYRFVPERLKLETLIGATKLAAAALMACDTSLAPEITHALKALVDAKRDPKHLGELEALHNLDAALSETLSDRDTEYDAIFRKLFKIIWMALFSHYYWIKQEG